MITPFLVKFSTTLPDSIFLCFRENQKFRVYVIIPLLPGFEGEIGRRSGASLHAITHWNYASICRGNDSLMNRLKEAGVENPSDYITFHGLRKYSEFRGTYVSELIYVHSKLMIVDDEIVICGSANINDRSLLGNRDSEIAVIIKVPQEAFICTKNFKTTIVALLGTNIILIKLSLQSRVTFILTN